VARGTALAAGVALPVVLQRLGALQSSALEIELALSAVVAVALARWQGRADGWHVGVGLLVIFVFYSVTR